MARIPESGASAALWRHLPTLSEPPPGRSLPGDRLTDAALIAFAGALGGIAPHPELGSHPGDGPLLLAGLPANLEHHPYRPITQLPGIPLGLWHDSILSKDRSLQDSRGGLTFARVQQRLDNNKRFASRNSTLPPSLLQGLAACAACVALST